jgi:hypothetical protein
MPVQNQKQQSKKEQTHLLSGLRLDSVLFFVFAALLV